jgi:hypothetical protein
MIIGADGAHRDITEDDIVNGSNLDDGCMVSMVEIDPRTGEHKEISREPLAGAEK